MAASRGTCLNRIQQLVHMIFHSIGGKGQINKETDRIIDNAGFTKISIDHFTLETKIFFMRPFIAGTAIK